jgi:hypothetical protein
MERGQYPNFYRASKLARTARTCNLAAMKITLAKLGKQGATGRSNRPVTICAELAGPNEFMTITVTVMNTRSGIFASAASRERKTSRGSFRTYPCDSFFQSRHKCWVGTSAFHREGGRPGFPERPLRDSRLHPPVCLRGGQLSGRSWRTRARVDWWASICLRCKLGQKIGLVARSGGSPR